MKRSKFIAQLAGRQIWPLSPLAFLTKLSKIPSIDYKTRHEDEKFQCENLEIMPDIMCTYDESVVNTNMFDLNAIPLHLPYNKFPEFSAKGVANVVAVKWSTNLPPSVMMDAPVKNCFLCLTGKRKVVLMSILKKYIWMVNPGSFEYCDMCIGNVEFGLQFPYDQYLQQMSVKDAIEMIDSSKDRQKRPRHDEFELEQANDRDLMRANQKFDEFSRRS